MLSIERTVKTRVDTEAEQFQSQKWHLYVSTMKKTDITRGEWRKKQIKSLFT
jgi:hypothetical protein